MDQNPRKPQQQPPLVDADSRRTWESAVSTKPDHRTVLLDLEEALQGVKYLSRELSGYARAGEGMPRHICMALAAEAEKIHRSMYEPINAVRRHPWRGEP